MNSTIQLSDNQLDFSSLVSLQKGSPNWLESFRAEEYSNYIQQPKLSRKIEHWKYNDTSLFTQETFVTSPHFDINVNKEKLIEKFILPNAIRCVLVNGSYSTELSNIESFNDSISFTTFSKANEKKSKKITELLASSLQKKNSLVQLNNSLSTDGILIEIDSNKVLETPVYVIYLNANTETKNLNACQVLVNCENNSQSTVLEHLIDFDNGTNDLNLQQSIINLEENSHCQHYRINSMSSDSRQISRVLSLMKKNSSFNSFHYSKGSLFDKTDLDLYHQGQNASIKLTGIYLPSGNQTVDYHTNVEHQVPHCTTQEIFRGIAADSSRATFNGKIHIFKDAQKSDAQLSNKNLLLTNQAEINTKPELEIYADDVVCAHGATIAKIDDQAIYYLQTRGINKTHAKKMLSFGFINELLEKIDNQDVSRYLHQQVESNLSEVER